MARALARGIVDAGVVAQNRISAADCSAEAADDFAALLPEARIAESNGSLVAGTDVVVLAVKPQNVASVARKIRSEITPDKLVVSIAAGVTLGALRELLGTDRLTRVMPNTPCLVGRSAAGYSVDTGATDRDVELIDRLLGAVGVAFRLEEKLLDAVTGLSGSGPAFVYLVIEALSDGGVLAGLPRPVALQLAAQTVRGAAEMVIETGEHPAVLRDRVASPGGTTIAGLSELESGALRSTLIGAVEAAARRSAELGSS